MEENDDGRVRQALHVGGKREGWRGKTEEDADNDGLLAGREGERGEEKKA